MQQWRGLIGADGCVEAPDMEYYNGITDADEIRAMVNEIFDGPMEGR
jgi:hypothetical protein